MALPKRLPTLPNVCDLKPHRRECLLILLAEKHFSPGNLRSIRIQPRPYSTATVGWRAGEYFHPSCDFKGINKNKGMHEIASNSEKTELEQHIGNHGQHRQRVNNLSYKYNPNNPHNR